MRILFAVRQPNLFQKFAFPSFEVNEDYRLIDEVLEDRELIMELAKDIPDTDIGRDRTPVEQTLRFLVLRHQKNLNYRAMEETLNVNLADRWFCKINDVAPCFKTIQNQLALIDGETVKRINNRIMGEAYKKKLTRGNKLRVDSTITKANIHFPTDVSLIADGIRTLVSYVRKSNIAPRGLRTFSRSLRRSINRLRSLGKKAETARRKIIQEVIGMGKVVLRQTKVIAMDTVIKTRATLSKVIAQADMVLQGQNPKDRVVSVFEPFARPFRKGKAGISCEFGVEVQVQEDEKFVTNWEINSKPSDTEFFPRALDKHHALFNKPPRNAATDRGYWSPENYEKAIKAGVKNISLPKKGYLNAEEQQRQSTPAFKRNQRYRAGGEAKISLLKRVCGLGRTRDKGERSMARWIGAGILACNLMTFARLLQT